MARTQFFFSADYLKNNLKHAYTYAKFNLIYVRSFVLILYKFSVPQTDNHTLYLSGIFYSLILNYVPINPSGCVESGRLNTKNLFVLIPPPFR